MEREGEKVREREGERERERKREGDRDIWEMQPYYPRYSKPLKYAIISSAKLFNSIILKA